MVRRRRTRNSLLATARAIAAAGAKPRRVDRITQVVCQCKPIGLSTERADHDRDRIAERGRVVSVKAGKFGDIRVSGTKNGKIIAGPIIQASFHNIF
jgi:hypothetical protein